MRGLDVMRIAIQVLHKREFEASIHSQSVSRKLHRQGWFMAEVGEFGDQDSELADAASLGPIQLREAKCHRLCSKTRRRRPKNGLSCTLLFK